MIEDSSTEKSIKKSTANKNVKFQNGLDKVQIINDT